MGKWDTVEGGALPGSDGPITVTVTEGSFNYDASYQDGEALVFILEGDCDHEHWQDTILYSIGNGWDTDDNVIVEGKDNFNSNTNYARFFRAVLDTKAADIVQQRDKDGSGEGPADASLYDGLIFKMERQAYTVNFGDGPEERFLLLPTKFVGEVGDKKSKAKGKGSKAKGKGKGGKGKASKANENTLRKSLVKLADKHTDHDEFVEAALDKFPEVEDFSDLYDEVLDEDGIFDS